MSGAVPDVRRETAALLEGSIDLNYLQEWFGRSAAAIELYGSDADVDLQGHVMLLLAEYTGNHISALQLLDALRAELETPSED